MILVWLGKSDKKYDVVAWLEQELVLGDIPIFDSLLQSLLKDKLPASSPHLD